MLLNQYRFVNLLRFNGMKELTIICDKKAPTQPLVDVIAALWQCCGNAAATSYNDVVTTLETDVVHGSIYQTQLTLL